MKIKTEWDLSPLLSGDHDPAIEKRKKDAEKRVDAFVKKWKNRTDFLSQPKVLREALDDYELWAKECGWSNGVDYYFWLRSMQDQSSTEIKAKNQQIEDFAKDMANRISFFSIAVSKIPKENQKKFLDAKELTPYHHHLRKCFRAAEHILNESEEKIMRLKATSAHDNWVRMTETFLSKEEREVLNEKGVKEKKSFDGILDLTRSTNKKVRDEAAEAFNDILRKHAEVAENELNSVFEDRKVNDLLRKYPRPDSARHVSDDIETETVDSIVKSISGAFDVSQRYYALKAKLMGVKKLAYHERGVPYGEAEKHYSYEESLSLVRKVLGKLDPEFGEIIDMFSDGHIDVYPRKGKSAGGFCVYWLPTHPVYIFLNHNNKLQDVRTMAHEFGHGINNEIMKKKQHALYFGTSLATAEVASTFMEDFVLEEIGKSADDSLKLSLIMKRLDDNVSSIFRQIACYRFEQELHSTYREKGYLSKEELGKIFQKHMAAYMGDAVEQSPGSENWWVYWSHIRREFYVYSYASGLLISKYLQRAVRKDPKFIEKVKEFLSAGESASPTEIFKKMGIDITQERFWKEGVAEIETQLKEAEKLAKKLGKI
jgi:oligoendopeptidase F